jgi:hypothetical protein
MRWTAVLRHAVDKFAAEAKERRAHLSRNLLTMMQRPAERCPRCGSSEVHHSHRSNPVDRVFWLLRWRAYRCHMCSCRFHAHE